MKAIDQPVRNGRMPAPDRFRALIVSVLFLSGLGVLILTVALATSLRPADPLAGIDARVGRIVATTNGRCQQFLYDNDAGTLSPAGTPCAIEEGEPARTGTARRLDAISRSFLRRD